MKTPSLSLAGTTEPVLGEMTYQAKRWINALSRESSAEIFGLAAAAGQLGNFPTATDVTAVVVTCFHFSLST
jgi:hypothetical protein